MPQLSSVNTVLKYMKNQNEHQCWVLSNPKPKWAYLGKRTNKANPHNQLVSNKEPAGGIRRVFLCLALLLAALTLCSLVACDTVRYGRYFYSIYSISPWLWRHDSCLQLSNLDNTKQNPDTPHTYNFGKMTAGPFFFPPYFKSTYFPNQQSCLGQTNHTQKLYHENAKRLFTWLTLIQK